MTSSINGTCHFRTSPNLKVVSQLIHSVILQMKSADCTLKLAVIGVNRRAITYWRLMVQTSDNLRSGCRLKRELLSRGHLRNSTCKVWKRMANILSCEKVSILASWYSTTKRQSSASFLSVSSSWLESRDTARTASLSRSCFPSTAWSPCQKCGQITTNLKTYLKSK